jgi:hypothetical protein
MQPLSPNLTRLSRASAFLNTLVALAGGLLLFRFMANITPEPVSLIIGLLACPVVAVSAQLYHLRVSGTVIRGLERLALVVLGSLPVLLVYEPEYFAFSWAFSALSLLFLLWLYDTSRDSGAS